jgi:RNA polymerase primary sigma factor
VQRPDDKLSELIAIGKGQGGWLTFSQVNAYLPDEAVNPEKLDMLLMSIEELGMEIVADKKLPYQPPQKRQEGGQRRLRGKVPPDRRSRADVPHADGRNSPFDPRAGNLARQENRSDA